MDKVVERDEYLRKCIADPSVAENFEEDVLEENLDLLLLSNEAFENVETSAKKRELLQIKKKTIDILNKLKEK